MFYYKFNLIYENFDWIGTKACRKKSFISPQWLRDTKNKKNIRFGDLILFLIKTNIQMLH